MKSLVQGVHHITLCPGGAQQDIDFFTQVLGQRLVKQTVLMDGNIPIYHFYYGNADADVGSIATCFPYSRKPGRAGSGQLSCTSYTVPNGAIAFWKEHFNRHRAEHSGVQERFGTKYLRVRHPAGLLFEMIEESGDDRNPWTTTQIPRDAGTRGFFGAVLSVRDVREQESFFVDALGFQKVGVDGPYHRFEVPGTGPGRIVDLHVEPERAPGSWGFGAGTAHHIAFNVETDDALLKQKAVYEELGFTDASEIKDRFYFHSMYVRSPGGILVECTANVPRWFFPGRGAGRTRDDVAPAAVVRGPAHRDRVAVGAHHGTGRKPAEAGNDVGTAACRCCTRHAGKRAGGAAVSLQGHVRRG